MNLRPAYAMSGTDFGYGTTSLRACYATSSTEIACGCYQPTGLLPNVRYPYWHSLSALLSYRPTGLLRTDLAYNATSTMLATSGTELAYGATRGPATADGLGGTESAICLRACYAMSGTDLAYGTMSAICLRASYAISGTDLAYGAIRSRKRIAYKGSRY
eukprot:3451114-Rhodomonas_salina.6